MGLIFGALGLLLMRYMRRRQYVRMYLAGTLFVLANSVFVMGTLADLFKPTTVAKLIILAVAELAFALAARVSLLSAPRAGAIGRSGPRPSIA
jgi:hypothetical protein